MGTPPKRISAWHFCADRGGKPVLRDGTPLEVGKTYHVAPPLSLCNRGLHGSVRPLDALVYAPGPWVCRTRHWGQTERGSDKICSEYRVAMWCVDATDTLRSFARQCALDVIHLWDAPSVVREYLDGGNEDTRPAARDAAWGAAVPAARAAAWAAAGDGARAAAWAAARDAAGDAVRAAARDAAGDAVRAAARDAAWAAAGDGAWDAAWGAAWDAARDAQNARLEAMLKELQ